MPRYIAFLRAINVGGHTVTMEVLRAPFVALGFKNVETFIASGNVIFESPAKSAAKLETEIENALQTALGYETVTFLRTDGALSEIATHTPFPGVALEKPTTLFVAFLKSALDTDQLNGVQAHATELDTFHTHGREFYWLRRGGFGDSKFGGGAFERAIGSPATFRNMTTVSKLAKKYPPA